MSGITAQDGFVTIWAIADIHASQADPETGLPTKPMDLFGPRWVRHMDRLEVAWATLVDPDDTVIVAGDIDWALRLEDAMETLHRLDRWNGRKVLIRGNHDYWWSSKTTNRVRRSLPPSLTLIHNNAVQADGFNICGAKGSPVPGGMDWTEQDEKLLNREQQRLVTSLQARDEALPTVAALHFPPFYPAHPDTGYRQSLEAAGVEVCVYGHLHGDAAANGPRGQYGDIEYRVVAGDAVDFTPVRIAADGAVLPDVGHAPAGATDATRR